MTGYLISVLLLTVPVTSALAPMRAWWPCGQLSWRLGFQINELPFVAGTWLLAVTALALVDGNLDTVSGVLGLVLATADLAGLALIAVRGIRARRSVTSALDAGLGIGWQRGLAPKLAARLRDRRPWLRIVFTPLWMRRADVIHDRNQVYGPAGRDNLLDVYRPRRGPATGPCLIHFHGGGYRTGTKNREARALLLHLASQGWVCASANYRRGRGRRWPQQLADAHQAVAWLHRVVHRYGADPQTLFVAGSSAGAHLAAMTALRPIDGTDSEPIGIAGAICLYGFYDTPTWIDRDPAAPSSPMALPAAKAVPFFIAHGSQDSFVPVGNARRFVEHLRASSRQPVVYAELAGAQHTFDLYHSPRFESVIDGIDAFTAWTRSRQPSCPDTSEIITHTVRDRPGSVPQGETS